MVKLIRFDKAVDVLKKLRYDDIEMYGCEIPECFDSDRAIEALDGINPEAYVGVFDGVDTDVNPDKFWNVFDGKFYTDENSSGVVLKCDLPNNKQKILVNDGILIWEDVFVCNDEYCALLSGKEIKLGMKWVPINKEGNVL